MYHHTDTGGPTLTHGQINDLLGSGQFDTKKHEIKTLDGKVSVTDVVSSESSFQVSVIRGSRL